MEDIPEPDPRNGSVLVEAVAVSVCGTDVEIVEGKYGWAPPGKTRLVLGHESLGRVIDPGPTSGFKKGDLVVGIVRRPDPVPCSDCAVGEWDISHSGTHIDLPAHFLPDGLKADDLLEREMVLEPAYFLSLPKEEDQEVGPDGLQGIEEMDDAEALLIRTGFGKFRDGMRDTYIEKHPWASPELPRFLRKAMPRLQRFGIDVLSLAVPQRPKESKDVHLGFLSNKPPTIIMEDVDLSNESLLTGKWRLRLYPWIIDEIEGLPVTALAQRIE